MRSGFLPETGERSWLTALSLGVAAEAHSSVVTYPWQQHLFNIGREAAERTSIVNFTLQNR